ncbi:MULTISPECIES: DMT family transporter [unclassified Paraburkholderia]|uniref:DMT family transporter n=1 Tax=unclassified Paraburkholderia TaxID=2615204 RepID=UPI0016127802|nr:MULTISPECIES: DMT family transporter [unclassified Paraburkholderia]MBB5448073.1 drug/metabolite transporter (DMT)-like permease [Paraburkholderia sp. WSM4177]MBB5488488.1 drug/metabolite transporter (DMT)-like permease [Paraburkholderia sp. WSM4180]
MRLQTEQPEDMTGVVWMLGGSCSMGMSFIYARKFLTPLKIPGVALTTYQVGFAATYLAAFTPFDGIGALTTHPQAAIGLIVGLGLLGTGIAYLAYYYVVEHLEHLGALAASSVTYIPPVVAFVISAVIIGEPTTTIDYLSVVLILAGVCIMQFGKTLLRIIGCKAQCAV